MWPERLPLTMRLGCDDFHEDGVRFDDAVWAVGALKGHGLDLADLSFGMNTDDTEGMPFNEAAFMVERGARVRRELGIPVAVSWNLGLPAAADRAIREGRIDLVFLGRVGTRAGRGGRPAERPFRAGPAAEPPRPVLREQRERIGVGQFARGPERPVRVRQGGPPQEH